MLSPFHKRKPALNEKAAGIVVFGLHTFVPLAESVYQDKHHGALIVKVRSQESWSKSAELVWLKAYASAQAAAKRGLTDPSDQRNHRSKYCILI